MSLMISRREALRRGLATAAALALPVPLGACADAEPEAGPEAPPIDPVAGGPDDPDEIRLHEWVSAVRESGRADPEIPVGITAIAVGELAVGARTPYKAFTLEEYLKAGGDPARAEPLTLSLQYFDCVTLVESCLAVARVARSDEPPTWEAFAREMERMRYRDGEREGYLSRLHYFSEWIDDNAARGLVEPLGEELGGVPDNRPLRFMTANRESYPALAYPEVYEELVELERELDDHTRWVIPTERIPEVSEFIQTGDILAFATSIEGLDVTHSAYAYRDDAGVLRVLHAPLSGGEVEITESTLPEYVAAIKRATGILVARPLEG
jgi:hypothetical protein